MPALVISANLPDVDILFALVGEGLSGRRGWTHGPLGLLVLPVLLTFGLLLFDRWQTRRGKRPADRLAVRAGPLLLVSYIGIATHPLLDLMNNWGIRLLMPFSERWFYGDALFIMDPWIWLALGAGIWLSRRRERQGTPGATTPAAASIAALCLYTGAMAAAGRAAESRAAHQFSAMGLGEPDRVLASPVFADPFRREIVIEAGDQYAWGDFRWFPEPHLTLDRRFIPTRMKEGAVAQAARQDAMVANFLYWSRYPFADIRSAPDGTRVTFGDARFGKQAEAGLIGAATTISGGATIPAAGRHPSPPTIQTNGGHNRVTDGSSTATFLLGGRSVPHVNYGAM